MSAVFYLHHVNAVKMRAIDTQTSTVAFKTDSGAEAILFLSHNVAQAIADAFTAATAPTSVMLVDAAE